MIAAHRFAYEWAKGSIPEGLHIRHRCHNPPCCNPAHLETGTAMDNVQDSIEADRHTKGEMHGQAKLTEEKVRQLRSMPSATDWNMLAHEWDVSVTTLRMARMRRTWKHVE